MSAQITAAEIIAELERLTERASDGLTRRELEIAWGLKRQAVMERLYVLDRLGLVRVVEKRVLSIDKRISRMATAYKFVSPESAKKEKKKRSDRQ